MGTIVPWTHGHRDSLGMEGVRGTANEGQAETNVPPRALVEDVERLLRSVSQLVRRRGRESLSGFAVTPPQFNALIDISKTGPLTMGELCQHLYLASSTVTDLVDRMERAALVERTRDGEDRRVVRLRVTTRGQMVIDGVMAARTTYLAAVLGRLTPEQRDAVLGALQLIAQEMMGVDSH